MGLKLGAIPASVAAGLVATEAATRAAQDGLLVPLIGARMVTVGHSFLQGGGVTHVDRQFITELAGMTRSDLRDLGVGASLSACDQGWGGTPIAWNAGVSYLTNQKVNYAGDFYICISGVTSATTPPNDASHWTKLATGVTGQGGWAWVLQMVVPIPTAGAPYTPGQNSLPLIVTGLNDIVQHANDGAGAIAIYKESVRTQIARFCAAKVYPSTDASIVLGGSGGTWQVKADTNKNSGSSYSPIPGNGATITWTLPADFEGGTVALGLTAWPAGDGQLAFTGTASQLPATKSLASLAYATGNTGAKRDSSNGIVIRISGLLASDAGKTIIATYSGGAGTQFATPATPGALVVTGGAAGSYSYRRVYRTYNGDTVQSAAVSTAVGPTTLDGTHYNTVPIGPVWPAGVEQELILRTVGGVAQGLIATLSNGPAAVDDKALVATAYTAPAANPLVGGAGFNYCHIEANSPAMKVGVYNNPTLPAAHLAALGVTSTQFANYNAALTALVAEFTDSANQVKLIDIDTILGANAALFNASPNPHPTNRGHAVVADGSRSILQSWMSGVPTLEIAHQSRVGKRLGARVLIRSSVLAPGVAQWGDVAGGVNSGQHVLTNAWTDIDSVNVVMPIDAQVGDDLEVDLSAMISNVAVATFIDACTCDANGNPVSYFASGTSTPNAFGNPGWSAPAVAQNTPVTGPAVYTVQAQDLITYFTVPGIVLVKIRGIGLNRVVYLGAFGIPFTAHLKNLGQRNTPGFNAS